MNRATRGALAGAAAATIWTACDPLFKKAFETPYSDAELLSALVTRGPAQPLASVAIHASNGAVFGWLFGRLGGRGVKQGVAVALAENAALWPLMPLFDRIHPSVRDGSWPKLFANPRVFAQAMSAHALFGALLGALGPSSSR